LVFLFPWWPLDQGPIAWGSGKGTGLTLDSWGPRDVNTLEQLFLFVPWFLHLVDEKNGQWNLPALEHCGSLTTSYTAPEPSFLLILAGAQKPARHLYPSHPIASRTISLWWLILGASLLGLRTT
jgi:hypothetical protein